LIGKSEWEAHNGEWTNNNFPVLVDPDPYNTWSSWGVSSLRELFFLDSNGNYYTQYNISPIEQVANIKNTIYDMLQDLNVQSYPEKISLFHAYPNPFNPSTNIAFSILEGSHYKLSIYDINGRYLETLLQSFLPNGSYTLTWNAGEYTSGIYFIKLDTEFNTLNQKLILIK